MSRTNSSAIGYVRPHLQCDVTEQERAAIRAEKLARIKARKAARDRAPRARRYPSIAGRGTLHIRPRRKGSVGMSIPTEAIEAAMSAADELGRDDANSWSDAAIMRAALSAAAPFIQAAALRDAESVVDAELQDSPPPNYEEDNYDAGYIAGLTFTQNRLRARADQLEGKSE